MRSTILLPVLATLLSANAAAVPAKRAERDPWAPASTFCLAETPGSRGLIGAELIASDMTYTKCQTFCDSKSFNLAYISYGTECRCGNELVNGASLTKSSSSCTMRCPGSVRDFCGGSWAFNLFVRPDYIGNLAADLTAKVTVLPSGWSAASSTCIAEGTRGRALNKGYFADPTMTPTKCAAYAQSLGAMYAGLQNSNECWAGDFIDNGASLSLTSTACTQKCSGDQAATCGGPWAISLYVNPALEIVAPTPPPAPAAPTLPTVTRAGWSAASNQCVVDVKGRSLTGHQWVDAAMTVDKCLERCTTRGFQYAAVEYSTECYCGSYFANGASINTVSNQCNMRCGGDSTKLCGGPDALQLYVNPSLAVTAPAANLPARWSAASTPCIAEVPGRALTGAFYTTNDMTVNKCITYCDARGYDFAGLEYGIGGECFCGSSLVNGASLSKPSTQCNMACRGDDRSFCGGPDAIQLYVYA